MQGCQHGVLFALICQVPCIGRNSLGSPVPRDRDLAEGLRSVNDYHLALIPGSKCERPRVGGESEMSLLGGTISFMTDIVFGVIVDVL